MSSVPELRAYIRMAAAERGIDPDIAVRVAESEGLAEGVWQSNVINDAGKRETSYGPYQLLVGGGLGDAFKAKYGLDPRDPSTAKQQIDFALDEASKGGWGPWYGAAKVGVDRWDGLKGSRARPGGTTETSDGLEGGDGQGILGGALDDYLEPRRGDRSEKSWRGPSFEEGSGGSKHQYRPFDEATGTGRYRTSSGKEFEFDAAGNSWRVDRGPVGSRDPTDTGRRRLGGLLGGSRKVSLDDNGYIKSHRYGDNSPEELRDHYERQIEAESKGLSVTEAGRMPRAADTETRRLKQTTRPERPRTTGRSDEDVLDEARSIVKERPHLEVEVRNRLRSLGIDPDTL